MPASKLSWVVILSMLTWNKPHRFTPYTRLSRHVYEWAFNQIQAKVSEIKMSFNFYIIVKQRNSRLLLVLFLNKANSVICLLQ